MSDIADSFSTGGWEFTPEVTEVFDEHVRASVPYYDDMQALVAELSDWLLPNNGLFVDLGASTGSTLVGISGRHPSRRIRAELYDEEASMAEAAHKKLAGRNILTTYHVQRLQKPFTHHDADLTVSIFTLQFLTATDRLTVLTEARRCSADSGALIIAEKIRPEHPLIAEIGMDASHDYKAKAGIPDSAIRSKARALRGVLIPQTLARIMDELKTAGWSHPDVLFRWHQWVIVIAFAR